MGGKRTRRRPPGVFYFCMRKVFPVVLLMSLLFPVRAEACRGPFAEFAFVFLEPPPTPPEATALHGRLVFSGDVFDEAVSRAAVGSSDDLLSFEVSAILVRSGEPPVRLYSRWGRSHSCDRSPWHHDGEVWVVARFDPNLGESDAVMLAWTNGGAWREP